MLIKISFILFYCVFTVLLLPAQTNTSAQSDTGINRFALVVGNADYPACPLKTPLNDAQLISDELIKLGFKVSKQVNTSELILKRAIMDFGNEVEHTKNAFIFIYYSGYVKQIKGKNYLVPVDANISVEKDIEFTGIALNSIFSYLENNGNNLNIFLLEPCSSDCFNRHFKSDEKKGLAHVLAPVGTIVSFSVSPGSEIISEAEYTALYTSEFVKALQIVNLPLHELFPKVRKQVYKLSDGKQIPWDTWSVDGEFYLNRP